MRVLIYMKHPATGRVHLMDPMYLFHDPDAITLCGLKAEQMTEMDETVSGLICNCYTCREEAGI